MAQFNQAMMDLYRYNGSILPQVRSKFSKNHSHSTTFDSGYLIPVFCDRVLPGDEKKIRLSALCRMSTPKFPTMDGAMLYFWSFFVPDRLWYKNAKQFYGENRDASFNPDGEYQMPHLKPWQYYVKDPDLEHLSTDGVGSLNDYFGFPVSTYPETALHALDDRPETYVTAGLHRSYHLIWNEHFRNSSIQPAEQLNDGDTVTDAEWNVIRKLKLVNKLPDRFTTLLREPQARGDVYLPLGEWAPVVSRNVQIPDLAEYYTAMGENADSVDGGKAMQLVNYINGNGVGNNQANGAVVVNTLGKTVTTFGASSETYYPLAPANLWADLTSASAATINNIRNAVTVQHLLELDNLSGKLYETIMAGHFGVFIPDAVTQRTQLLGVCKRDISMRQVLQTSQSSDVSPQGNPAGLSVTQASNELIVDKSFLEPGFIMILAAVRPVHSYSQGINPLWQKLKRYDHYWPVFDRLGNQPVMTSEVFATNFGSMDADVLAKPFNTVLGYRPAWDEYRIMSNRVSGLFRPELRENLSAWNYASKFDEMPVLNSEFIEEDPELMDRTIAVQTEPQFLLDCYFEYTDSKNMSVNSVPGLTRL